MSEDRLHALVEMQVVPWDSSHSPVAHSSLVVHSNLDIQAQPDLGSLEPPDLGSLDIPGREGIAWESMLAVLADLDKLATLAADAVRLPGNV